MISGISDTSGNTYIAVSRTIFLKRRKRKMTQITTKRPETQLAKSVGKYGVITAALGALLVLLDGIVVLAINSTLAPSVGGVYGVGASEIVLSILAFITLAFYRRHPRAVGVTVLILALISYAVGGGFYYVGATLALIGAILVGYRR